MVFDTKISELQCPVCQGPTPNRDRWEYHKPLPCSVICAKELGWRKLCPSEYRKTDPAKLPPAAPYARIMAWEYQSRGLLLMGDTRLGKTRCAYQLLRGLYNQGKNIRAFGATQFENDCSQAYSDFRGPSWLRAVCDADVVFLDDLGKGVLTKRPDEALFSLVEYRTSRGLPLIITTNLSGAELKNASSENRGVPLVARLREFCEVVYFGKEK